MLTSDLFEKSRKRKKKTRAAARSKPKRGFGIYLGWPGYGGLVGDGTSSGDGGGDGGGMEESQEELFEVKMSPNRLLQWAQSEEAKGIRAGFEAELIFADTQSGPDGSDRDDYYDEPDMDMDERVDDLDDVFHFFRGGDGYLSDRAWDRIRDQVNEQYMEFIDEIAADRFDLDALENNVGSSYTDEEWMSKARAELGDDAEDGEIRKRALEIYREYLQEVYDEGFDNEEYQEAYDEFRDDLHGELLSDFLESADLRYMSDWYREFELDWPYMLGDERESNYGSRDWDEIAGDLKNELDLKDVRTGGYHGVMRREGRWILEQDGSLSPDDSDTDAGIEIVSPPMPLPEALDKLNRLAEWARDSDRGNAYTNNSTGLHMGVSLPFKNGSVDFVKLVLFLGDKKVLEDFHRTANGFAKSAFDKLSKVIKSRPLAAQDMAYMIQKNLIQLAEKQLGSFGQNEKYTSVHAQEGYVEFRGAGGRWLDRFADDQSLLQATMARYAYAMHLAGRPDLEREEYAKKLTKLISNAGAGADVWAKFQSGQINVEQLKTQWAAQYGPELDDREETDIWIIASKDDPNYLFTEKEFSSKEEAEEYLRDHGNRRAQLRYTVTKSIRSYWEIIDADTEEPKAVVYGTKFEALDKRNSDPELRGSADVRPMGGMQGKETADWEVFDPDSNQVIKTYENQRLEKAVDDFLYNDLDIVSNNGVFDRKTLDDRYPNAYVRRKDGDAQEPKPKKSLNRRQELARRIVQRQTKQLGSNEQEWIVWHGRAVDDNTKFYKITAPTEDVAKERVSRRDRSSSGSNYSWSYSALLKSDASEQWLIFADYIDSRDPTNVKTIENRLQSGATKEMALKVFIEKLEADDYKLAKGTTPRIKPLVDPSKVIDLDKVKDNKFPEVATQYTTNNLSNRGGGFTGYWLIKSADGRTLHRFGGIGNVQADANRIARDWIQQNSTALANRNLESGIEVVPEMNESRDIFEEFQTFKVRYLQNNLPKQATIVARSLTEATDKWKNIATKKQISKYKITGV